MPSQDLHALTIDQASVLIQQRQLSPVELTQAYLDRIEALDGSLHAFVKVMPDALDQARAAEAEIARGAYRGPLHGVSFAVKDQFDAAGAPSLLHGDASAHDSDATPIARLKAAGAIFLGKLAMTSLHPYEHLVSAAEQPPEFPAPRNPWNLERLTGGSSSGSGAAVAGGLCTASLGEDTAGSIRGPAANCGLVGAIATYGRVSRHGLCPMSWTQDHCGPLTLTVKDAAYVLQAISGHDPNDLTTSTAPVPDFVGALQGEIKGAVIGVPRKFVESEDAAVKPDVMSAFGESLTAFKSLGAKIVDVDIPLLEATTLISFVIYAAEFHAATLHDPIAFKATSPLYRIARAYLGAVTPAPDYLRAQRLRAQFQRDFQDVFHRVDFIATPTQGTTAPLDGPLNDGLTGLGRQMAPEFRAMWNIIGAPALTLPCGFDSDGMPIGLQIGGPAWQEGPLLCLAHAYEQTTGWHSQRPAVVLPRPPSRS